MAVVAVAVSVSHSWRRLDYETQGYASLQVFVPAKPSSIFIRICEYLLKIKTCVLTALCDTLFPDCGPRRTVSVEAPVSVSALTP